jgi:hypothetical protein
VARVASSDFGADLKGVGGSGPDSTKNREYNLIDPIRTELKCT